MLDVVKQSVLSAAFQSGLQMLQHISAWHTPEEYTTADYAIFINGVHVDGILTIPQFICGGSR